MKKVILGGIAIVVIGKVRLGVLEMWKSMSMDR
jgi:hypothetical protein